MKLPTRRLFAYLCVPLFFFLAAESTASAQTYSFGQASLAAGKQPISMAVGDFNGDSSLDLVVANLADNTVSIFLAQPDGTLSPKVDYATGLQPYSVAVGDFNGDGNLDIVVTNENCTNPPSHLPEPPVCGPGSVSILLGNGDGTFQSHVEYGTGTAPISVTARDLNGDGKLDLVVVNNQDNSISILIGMGDGTFAAHVDYPATLQPTVAIVADFNNDGRPDVAAGSAAGVSVWLGNGDGTLQTRADFQLRDLSAATSLAAADFNRDGNQDLAVSGASAGTSIFLGNGNGTFTFQAIYPSGSGATIAVDLNNDGKTDLAVVDTVGLSYNPSFAVAILLGNGDGTFQPSVTYAAGGVSSDVVAGDFNGDGQLDLAISNNSCFVEGLNFPETSCSAGSVTVLLGDGQGVLGAGPMNAGTVGTNPTFLLPVDLNGDQKPDLVVVNQGDDTVSVLLGNGDGTFKPQATYATGHLPVSVQVGDFNGDGKLDLAVVNQICGVKSNSCAPGSVSVLLGNGDGTLQPPMDFAVGLTPMSLAIADFNGDGKPDLAVTNANLGLGNTVSILTGKGDGTFNAHVDYAVVNEPGPIVAADFNHDGKIDLAVACEDLANTEVCPSPLSLSILLGNGDATFQRHDFLSTSNFSHGPSSLAVGDFNGDTNVDLVAGDLTGSGFSVFLGNGDGTFQPGGMGAGLGVGVNFFALGDFYGDGKFDVALAEDLPRVVIFHGNGDGTFQPAQILLLPADRTFSDPVPVSGDFNGDGSLDLAVLQPGSNNVSIFLNGAFKAVFPTSLAFGSQGSSTSSVVHTVTIANPSAAPFTISSVIVSGAYTQTNNCITKLLPGQNCTINVTFAPITTGVSNGSITLTDTTHASPQVIPVTGTGVNGPFLRLSQAHLALAATAVGGTSAPRSVTLTNTGNAILAITNVAITGGNAADFGESNTCGSSLAVGATCNVSVTFTPTAGGTRISALAITDSAVGSPHMVNLSGTTPSPGVSLSAASLTFTAQVAGTSSPSQSVTLSNIGAAALSIAQISVTGDFAQTNNCGASVAAAGSCQISVTFTPTAAGSRTGALTIADSASGSPQTVTLTGTGQDFSMASSGTTSATVTPGQTATYTLSLASSGGFSGNVALTCSGAPSGATCSVSPATVSVIGTTAANPTVTVTTTAPSPPLLPSFLARPPRAPNERAAPLLLECLLIAGFLSLFLWRRDQRLRAVPVLTFALLLCAGLTMTSCGGGSSGGGGGGGGGSPGTPAGSYTMTVTATATSGSTTLTHSTKLTLVVQ
jgi:hypothetical protein